MIATDTRIMVVELSFVLAMSPSVRVPGPPSSLAASGIPPHGPTCKHQKDGHHRKEYQGLASMFERDHEVRSYPCP